MLLHSVHDVLVHAERVDEAVADGTQDLMCSELPKRIIIKIHMVLIINHIRIMRTIININENDKVSLGRTAGMHCLWASIIHGYLQ